MSEPSRDSDDRIRLGVSSCLLGNEVRFDGGHKRDRFLTDQLGDFVEWVPVCPEVEAGFGTPRPSMRLVQEGDAIRVKESRTGRDHTRKLETWSARRARSLRPLDRATPPAATTASPTLCLVGRYCDRKRLTKACGLRTA